MYTTSTYFIKGQIPGVTVSRLLELYKNELLDQNVSEISMHENKITFSNNTFKIFLNRYSRRLSGFSEGEISILDSGSEYDVSFKSDFSRLFKTAALSAGVVTFLFFFGSGFQLFSLLFGLVVFLFIAGIGYSMNALFFPVYFTELRNRIERRAERRIILAPTFVFKKTIQ